MADDDEAAIVPPPPATRPPTSPENIALAEKEKDAANALFKEKHFAQAIDRYTKAIELHPNSAIYYANRAFASSKLENYGSAIADATAALELDPTYVKAYYRRGDANFAMGKFKLALKDLRTAAKVAPRDPDLRKKLAECEKEVKRLRFEEALAAPEEVVVLVSSTIDLASMDVEESYKGPRMQGSQEEGYTITLDFVQSMLAEFKEQRVIHRRFAYEIVLKAQELFRQQASLVDVSIPENGHLTVCGDTHGQFYDLLRIWELNGRPAPDNPYLFNGDFVDRGSFSLEVILSLMAYKVLYPDSMHLTRGNHESKSMNKIYGFEGEVKAKYNSTMAEVFRETFCWMPLAYVLNGKVLVVHGGLFSKDGVTLDDIRKIDRFREPPEEGLMCELLWSDPGPINGRQPSKRGVGVSFGPDVTKAFLDQNGLELLVRSHEVKEEGYQVEHDGRCVTIFSAPNYCDQMGNKGAFIRFNGNDMVPHFTTFEAVPHPNVKAMAYASSYMFM
ncbi:phosphatase 5-like protein [Haematococcus lacustris]